MEILISYQLTVILENRNIWFCLVHRVSIKVKTVKMKIYMVSLKIWMNNDGYHRIPTIYNKIVSNHIFSPASILELKQIFAQKYAIFATKKERIKLTEIRDEMNVSLPAL